MVPGMVGVFRVAAIWHRFFLSPSRRSDRDHDPSIGTSQRPEHTAASAVGAALGVQRPQAFPSGQSRSQPGAPALNRCPRSPAPRSCGVCSVLADGLVYRHIHAGGPDAESMATIQAVVGKAHFQQKVLTLTPGAPIHCRVGLPPCDTYMGDPPVMVGAAPWCWLDFLPPKPLRVDFEPLMLYALRRWGRSDAPT